MSLIPIHSLALIRQQHPHQKIGFCSGVFDLTHAGHVLFLENCKSHVDVLVAAVGSDTIVKARKGVHRPIQSEQIRARSVDALKPVDYCFVDTVSSTEDLLAIIPYVFNELKPDVYIINNDAFNIQKRQAFADHFGIRMVVQERVCPPEYQEISTTKIIETIRRLDGTAR